MHLREVGCGDMDWIDLAQDTQQVLMTVVINFQVP